LDGDGAMVGEGESRVRQGLRLLGRAICRSRSEAAKPRD
jgi:hypothetical protein